jgi:hypothetical protein
MTVPERAAALLVEQGIPAHAEPFDGSIRVEDDGALWYFGTVNETWDADILSDPAAGVAIGSAVTAVPSDTTDPVLLADAIIAALTRGVGVHLWRNDP